MKRLIGAILPIILLLSACAKPQPSLPETYTDTHWVKVYYAAQQADKSDAVIVYEDCELPVAGLEQTIRYVFDTICNEPISKSLKSPIPDNVQLKAVDVEDGTATVDLSREYGSISGFYRTLADYCLTMSLCGLEGIRDVQILVDGVTSYGREKKLSPDDVVLAGLELSGYRKSLKLYFPDLEYTTLKLELRDTISTGEQEDALLVVKALMDGPNERGNRAVIPYGTRINSVRTEKGVCTVDFSAEYVKNRIDGEIQERMSLRALVDSLTEINGVEQVQILIDGARIKGFSNFDLSKPFSRGYI